MGTSPKTLSPKESLEKGIFIVRNNQGLHTRPSTEIVKCASGFKSEIKLSYKKLEVNAKSILGILMLAAGKGSKIRISALGCDAKEAVESLIELSQNQFNVKY